MGFKLHLIINTKGQIIAAKITQGNVDDRDVVRDMTENLSGKMAGDKGYISKSLFDDLFIPSPILNQALNLKARLRKPNK